MCIDNDNFEKEDETIIDIKDETVIEIEEEKEKVKKKRKSKKVKPTSKVVFEWNIL